MTARKISLMESLALPIRNMVNAMYAKDIAKERYEKTLAMRREAYHAKKSERGYAGR